MSSPSSPQAPTSPASLDSDTDLTAPQFYLGWGLARSGGGRPVAAQDLALGAAGFGGAVGVQGQGPAQPVDAHLVVVVTQQDQVGQPGLAAAGAVDDVVHLAAGRGLVAAAGPRAV